MSLMEIWIVWLVAAAILIIVEILSQMMWALCLAGGSMAAMVCALCGLDLTWQIVALAVAAIVVYVVCLPVFRRWHERTALREARTGMDALLGRRGIVTHEIRPGSIGRVRIDGDNWQAVAPGLEAPVRAGSEVSVTAYDSIILTVQPAPER